MNPAETKQPVAETKIAPTITQSPVPHIPKPESLGLSFYQALHFMLEGKKVTRRDWDDETYYGFLNDSTLRLHKPDGKLYDWIIVEGDVRAKDWIII